MDISRDDAIKAVHKVILNHLLDSIPTTNVSKNEHNAYLKASNAICDALKELPSWYTKEDPEDSGEYLVTYETSFNNRIFRGITIAEWRAPLTNCDGDILEDGEWYFDLPGDVIAWATLPDKYTEVI